MDIETCRIDEDGTGNNKQGIPNNGAAALTTGRW